MSEYLIKFASPIPVPKILSSPQIPFQSSNHSVSCKMNLDDDKGKVGKAVFRREKLGVDMAHDWNKASKQESFSEQEKSFPFGKTSSQYGT